MSLAVHTSDNDNVNGNNHNVARNGCICANTTCNITTGSSPRRAAATDTPAHPTNGTT